MTSTRSHVRLIVALTILVAAGTVHAAEPIVLQWWVPGTSELRLQLYSAAGELYNQQNPNVRIEVTNVGDGFIDKLQVAVAAGAQPDIVAIFGAPDVLTLALAGALEPLNDHLAKLPEWNEADILPGFLETMSWDGKLWALPIAAQPTSLVWGEDVFNRAGLAPIVGSIDEVQLSEYSRRLTTRGADGRLDQVGFLPDMWGGFIHWAYHWGADVFDEAAQKVTLTTPAVVAAMEWMENHYQSLGGIDAVNQWKGLFRGSGTPAMYLGKQGMAIWSHYHHYFSTLYGDGYRYGFAPPPLMGSDEWGPKGPIAHTDGRAVVKGSPHPLEATKFLLFITQGDGFPIVAEGYPSTSVSYNRRLMEENLLPDWMSRELWMQHLEVLLTVRSWPRTLILGDLDRALDRATSDVMNGRASVLSALEDAERVLQAQLDQALNRGM